MPTMVARLTIISALALFFFVPALGKAQFDEAGFITTFGGRVATVLPCFNGGLYFTVVGARPGTFAWTPFSATYLHGPPRTGVNTLGIAGALYGCVIGFTGGGTPIIRPFQQAFIIGTSLSI